MNGVCVLRDDDQRGRGDHRHIGSQPAGSEPLAVRDVARRVGRDVQAVHRDVAAPADAGVLDRSDGGVAFPCDRIHVAFDIGAAA